MDVVNNRSQFVANRDILDAIPTPVRNTPLRALLLPGKSVTPFVLGQYTMSVHGSNSSDTVIAVDGMRVNYLSGSGLQADNRSDEVRPFVQNPPGIAYLWQVNPSFGGPIVRNRLWFYLTYKYEDSKTYVASSQFADGSQAFRQSMGNYTGVGRLTWQASERDKVRFYLDRQFNGEFYNGFNTLPNTTPEASTDAFGRGWVSQLQWSQTTTNRLLLEGGLTYYNQPYDLFGTGKTALKANASQYLAPQAAGYAANFNGMTNKVGTPTDNLRTYSDINRTTYNGFEVSANARFSKALFFGGVTTDRRATEACDERDNPNGLRFCDSIPPFRTTFKLSGAYQLPWDFQLSGTFLAVPGSSVSANYTVTAAIAGRPIIGTTAGATTIGVNLIEPNTLFLDYRKTFDLRLARTFRFDRYRMQPFADFFNVLNLGTVTRVNQTFGANPATNAWMNPQAIQDGRYIRFGIQMSF